MKKIKLLLTLTFVLVLAGCCDNSIIDNNCDGFNKIMMAVYLPTFLLVFIASLLIATYDDPSPSDERDGVIVGVWFVLEVIWAIIYWGSGLGEYIIRLFT